MSINVLNDWFKEYQYLSSVLHPKGRIYRREDILRVRQILTDYFGEEFFNIQPNTVRTIQDSNWIVDLLSRHERSTVLSLFEVCNLIEFLQRQSPEIQAKMKSTVHRINDFQNLFFELYVYKLFEYNKTWYDPKVKKGDQELEGMCRINGKEFLFECKKPTFLHMEELEAFVQILQEFQITFNKAKVGKELVGYIQLKQNFKQAKNDAIREMKKFVKNPQNFFGTIDFQFENDLVNMRIEAYDEVRYIEYTTQELKPRVIFKIVPPTLILTDTPSFFRAYGEYDFTVDHDEIIDKFLKVLRGKRKQHNRSKDQPRIFFFDNEYQSSFKMPLLPLSGLINDDKIMEYLREKETSDILCIVYRNYIANPPSVKIKVYCKDEFADVKNVLENLKTDFSYKIRK